MLLGIGRKPMMKRGGPRVAKRLIFPRRRIICYARMCDRYLAAYDGYKRVKNIA